MIHTSFVLEATARLKGEPGCTGMVNKYEKNTTYESVLRTCCAERTRAMQLVCMCASYACTVLFMGICVQKDMEVQV